MQFELDCQLAAAARAGKRSGMCIGLYTDLAVGSLASGFDAWVFPGLFVDDVSLGAPPDAYAPEGQNWSLPPLDPLRLRADWLAKWLADPGHIQPGTKMPANFPANPEENAFPEILGGDQKAQIEAVRSYLLTLGPAGLQALSSAAPTAPRAGTASIRPGTDKRTGAMP